MDGIDQFITFFRSIPVENWSNDSILETEIDCSQGGETLRLKRSAIGHLIDDTMIETFALSARNSGLLGALEKSSKWTSFIKVMGVPAEDCEVLLSSLSLEVRNAKVEVLKFLKGYQEYSAFVDEFKEDVGILLD